MSEKVKNFVDDYLGLQIASIALLLLATTPILIGSYCSLQRTSTRRTTRSQEEDHFVHPKVITVKDAFLFPLIISTFVYILSCLTHSVHPDYLNDILTLSTGLLFTLVFSSTVLVILKNILPSLFQNIDHYHFSFNNKHKKLCHLNVTVIHLIVYLISIGVSVIYVITQHWIIENLFATSIAIHLIRYLTLKSFGTGFLLLIGMLAYDMFWIFGTNTLVDLSKILVHAPTSVVWPRNINTYILDKLLRKDQYFTMYGLGEIIIPGIFIAYSLQHDKLSAKRGHPWKFAKPYFKANLVAYALGAAVSIYTVHFTKKSQSAFVYTAPALIVTTCILALVRNEFSVIYDGSDILSTFRGLSGFNEEHRPSFEERLRTPRATRRSKSKSTPGVIEEAIEETRKAVGPYVEGAMEETKQFMEPYIDEAVKTTKKAINDVATKVQEQTTVEEAPKRRARSKSATRGGRGRGGTRGRSRSKSVTRGRGRGRKND